MILRRQIDAEGMTFSGPKGVATYRAIVIKAGLKMYMLHRIKPNSAYTPTAMLRVAGEITGKHYKRREYERAINDLQVWIDANGTAGDEQ
jgi:hypothetical protein